MRARSIVLAVFLLGLAGTAWGETEENLWQNPVSSAFSTGPTAELWDIWFNAAKQIEIGKYVDGDELKYTYYKGVRFEKKTLDINTLKDTIWSFYLPYTSKERAFNLFLTVRNRLLQFVPVEIHGDLFFAYFADGHIAVKLMEETISISITLNTIQPGYTPP
jgi:hypothetical protein